MVGSLESHVPRHPLIMPSVERLDDLEGRLGYSFANRAFLAQALTHASFLTPDEARLQSYQRLEFLGDRVLGLTVAAMLFDRFADAPEGQLSRALAELVRKETCAAVAQDLGIGPHLRIGKGERRNGLAKKPTVLGDVCEALLGAVYLDGGFAAADRVIRTLWDGRVPDISGGAGIDPKTALQEWAHTRSLPEPRYQELDRTGPDHAPVFRVAAVIAGLAPSEGEGRSKRAAERAAAERMLARETGTEPGQ